MNAQEFTDWLAGQQLVLNAFGKFVVDTIKERVAAELPPAMAKTFFKIEPSFRSKELVSAQKKQEKKKYPDPKSQMTDLVGVRFVVLLRSDIGVVERCLIDCTSLWTTRRDREPKAEADSNPDAFRYQSVHYVIRNIEDRPYDGVIVPAETACEVQIRTLLQHAYAEFDHDRIYKGNAVIPPSVHRLVARSMALMETTDSLFCEAVEELNRLNKDIAGWCQWLDGAYKSVGTPALETHDDDDARLVLETYKDLLAVADDQKVSEYFRASVVERVKLRPRLDDLFSRPVVMLVYWLLANHPQDAAARWPLPKFRDDVELIAADLGLSLDLS